MHQALLEMGSLGGSGEVGEGAPPVVPGCKSGQTLWDRGLPAPYPADPMELGSGGPWRGELAQPGPQPAQPGRRELISRLSPRPLPLPLSSPSSLFLSLFPGPAPMCLCQAPCPGGCQAPGGARSGM